MDKEFIGSLPFEFDSRVPIQLGRESISNSIVAISELIKNAYDADAEEVFLKFILSKGKYSVLVVEDDGIGMNLNDLKNNWMKIGTLNKTERITSKDKHRVLTGAKGLGRLGIDRLCDNLVLQTKKKNMDKILELNIDWKRYEKSNHSVSEIKHDYYWVPLEIKDSYGTFLLEKRSKGTRLIMKNLKDNWTEEFLQELKQHLSALVSPFRIKKDFEIKLSSGLDELDGTLSSENLLLAAEWKLKLKYDSEDQLEISLRSDVHNESYSIEPVNGSDWLKGSLSLKECGPFTFELYFIPRKKFEIEDFSYSVLQIKDFLDANQGIRIYRDHFRVRPYGDHSGRGDWLNLGIRRSKNPQSQIQKGWVVGEHQIIGAIFIGRETNPNLTDQTNREGLVETAAFYSLRAAILEAIKFLEAKVHASARKRHNPSERRMLRDKLKKENKSVRDSAAKLRGQLKDLSKDISNKSGIDRQIIANVSSEAEKIVNSLKIMAKDDGKIDTLYSREIRYLSKDKDLLSNLASLGILTVSFGHEARDNASKAKMNATNLRELLKNKRIKILKDYKDNFDEQIKSIYESTDFIYSFASFALGNISMEKRKRTPINLSKVIHSVFDVFQNPLDKQNILIDLPDLVKDFSKIRAFEIDWESIIVNLITNSISALEDTLAESRLIKASLESQSGVVKLSFADSGRGLELGTAELIYNPLFSTKRDRRGNTIGTGMGLAIVKSFVEDHTGGSIQCKSPGELGGAEFIITIPTMKSQEN